MAVPAMSLTGEPSVVSPKCPYTRVTGENPVHRLGANPVFAPVPLLSRIRANTRFAPTSGKHCEGIPGQYSAPAGGTGAVMVGGTLLSRLARQECRAHRIITLRVNAR